MKIDAGQSQQRFEKAIWRLPDDTRLDGQDYIELSVLFSNVRKPVEQSQDQVEVPS
jgi:hypothetical protein